MRLESQVQKDAEWDRPPLSPPSLLPPSPHPSLPLSLSSPSPSRPLPVPVSLHVPRRCLVLYTLLYSAPCAPQVPAQMMPLQHYACSRALCTAYRLLEDYGGLKPGDTIIQNAADLPIGQVIVLAAVMVMVCVHAGMLVIAAMEVT